MPWPSVSHPCQVACASFWARAESSGSSECNDNADCEPGFYCAKMKGDCGGHGALLDNVVGVPRPSDNLQKKSRYFQERQI